MSGPLEILIQRSRFEHVVITSSAYEFARAAVTSPPLSIDGSGYLARLLSGQDAGVQDVLGDIACSFGDQRLLLSAAACIEEPRSNFCRGMLVEQRNE